MVEFKEILKNPSPNLKVPVYTEKEGGVKPVNKPTGKMTLSKLAKMMNARINDLERNINARIDKIEQRLDYNGLQIEQINKRLDYNGLQIEQINKRLDYNGLQIEQINKRLDYNNLKDLPKQKN